MAAIAYLVVANPSAKNNLGTLIRCAAAFSVEEVVVVGSSKWSTHGAHGSNKVQSAAAVGTATCVAVTFCVAETSFLSVHRSFIHNACLVCRSCAASGGKTETTFELLPSS